MIFLSPWVCVCVGGGSIIFISLGHPLRKGMDVSKDIYIFKGFVQVAKLFPEMLFTCLSGIGEF